ncbi:transporter substrate-binding domain-containing protein [Mobiluncus sp.]|uniref:transporter substrate-binding domain-containing protein n=1 Tax=Mobiluncus sp. TaxID=47293 RepID=UPI002A9086A8|nr:transporter substrate-binding domain-containing protein [Mobiluncus sp.]MDY6077558.1 transporter substrate-binding domain-containing protein [Mobiluncus sp.]
MNLILKIISAATGAALLGATLASCSGSTSSAEVKSYNFDSIKPDSEIAAMLPQANRDTLRVAMDIPYSPAEFFDSNNQPVGYEVDVLKALSKLMGVSELKISDEDFDAIIPKVNDGTYDIGMASMTVNKSRMAQTNMVAYIQAGYVYGTQAGNPNNFDPANACGLKVATQADTTQAETLQATSDSCVKAGKPAIQIVSEADQDKLVKQVADGTLDAIIGESPMMAYAESRNPKFATIGEAFQVAPQGPATAKDNPELAKAIQAGLQKMMDTGMLKEVLAPWGEEFIALNYATLNPPIA